MQLQGNSLVCTPSDARVTHRDASAEDHIAEATHLLADIPEMVAHGKYGWGSTEAGHMLAAADAHIRLAELKREMRETRKK